MEYLRGERELMCTAWGNPTYNPRGWKGPCYLMTDAHHETFKEFIEKTPWENYGRGRDPRCEDCMVHAGYEASAVLGGNKKLGDTWKMLSWTLSGKMGGLKGGRPRARTPRHNGNGHSNGHGNGAAQWNGNGAKRVIPRSSCTAGRRGFPHFMTTLVTGATGFVGSHVARQLVEPGPHGSVSSLARQAMRRFLDGLPRRARRRRFARCRFDRTRDEAVFAACSTSPPITGFGRRDPKKFTRATSKARGAYSKLRARAGVERIVYTSTVATIAVPRHGALAERRNAIATLDRNDRPLQAFEIPGRSRKR